MKQLCFALLGASLALLSAPSSWADSAAATVAAPVDTNAVKWVGSAAAGLTLTRGNSHTLLATANLDDSAKWLNNEVKIGADAAYGKSSIDGVNSETAETLHGFVQYNRLFTERFYGYARIDGLHDGIADIQYRLTLAPGAGYYFVKNKRWDLSGEVGPGFIVEKLGDSDKDYLSLRVAEAFHYQLSDRARVWQTAELLPQVDKFENYIFNFELGIEADLTAMNNFTLRAFFYDSYNNRPAANRLNNDSKIVTAIAYKF
jgi:putative salt-induced outer membrane protein